MARIRHMVNSIGVIGVEPFIIASNETLNAKSNENGDCPSFSTP